VDRTYGGFNFVAMLAAGARPAHGLKSDILQERVVVGVFRHFDIKNKRSVFNDHPTSGAKLTAEF
jgi:hypothetical protein